MDSEDGVYWDILESCWNLDPNQRLEVSGILEKLNPRVEHPVIKDVFVDYLDDDHNVWQVSDNGTHSEPTNKSLITSTQYMSSTAPFVEPSILAASDGSPNFFSQDTGRSKYLSLSSMKKGHSAFSKSTAKRQATGKQISSLMPTRHAVSVSASNVQRTTTTETRIGYHITWRDNGYDIVPVFGSSAVFSQPQLAAARAILRVITAKTFMLIPDYLITKELAETSIYWGYCLIGACRFNRQKRPLLMSPFESSENTLNFHIQYKHFICTHFPCDCWYVLLISFSRFLCLAFLLTYSLPFLFYYGVDITFNSLVAKSLLINSLSNRMKMSLAVSTSDLTKERMAPPHSQFSPTSQMT